MLVVYQTSAESWMTAERIWAEPFLMSNQIQVWGAAAAGGPESDWGKWKDSDFLMSPDKCFCFSFSSLFKSLQHLKAAACCRHVLRCKCYYTSTWLAQLFQTKVLWLTGSKAEFLCVTWVVGVGDGGADGVCLQGEGGRRRHSCTTDRYQLENGEMTGTREFSHHRETPTSHYVCMWWHHLTSDNYVSSCHVGGTM